MNSESKSHGLILSLICTSLVCNSAATAMSSSAPPNVDLFDAYFRRADLDRDGRISGAEAVSFFQGSGLPKNVLAQVCLFVSSSISSSAVLLIIH